MPTLLRLLIVEDSESDAALLVRLFTKAGYQVVSRRVETRDSLQAALAQDAWDCVIADHNMPELDAFAALETLRSSGLDIPFIVASGSIGEETAVALMKSGAADYVMKEKMARLTAVMERELRDASARRERRQAIDALRANEEKYRRLFDLESDALFLIERDGGRILEANAGATALYGYSHDEWLTMRNVDVSAEPDRTTAATRAAMTNIPVRWHQKKDGTVFPVDIRATHFEWEGRPVHLAAIRDITERVSAQEALRAERDRAEAYIQIAGVILLALDTQGKITLINRSGCEVLGYSEGELLGRDWFDSCLLPADRQAVRAGFDQMMTGDDVVMADFMNNVITKTGDLKLISWRNRLLRDADGRTIGTLSSGEDITERKLAEDTIRASLSEKEILLKEIHHRVKNNLQIIASLLTLQAQSVRDPVALEVLRDSQNRIRAMSLIHAKLYESSGLARVDFGAFARDLGTILLRAYAVNPSAIQLRVSAGQADLDVDTLVPCSLIVNELLANAIKHAFPSGAGGTIEVELSHEDGAYILRVADDGVGFPSAVDFRDTTTLGLRLVNMLVEQLDGTIEMLNEGGTAFTIRFQRGAGA